MFIDHSLVAKAISRLIQKCLANEKIATFELPKTTKNGQQAPKVVTEEIGVYNHTQPEVGLQYKLQG